MTNNKDIAKELGRSGGKATLKKYGKKHFKKIIRKRWDDAKNKNENPVSEAPIDK